MSERTDKAPRVIIVWRWASFAAGIIIGVMLHVIIERDRHGDASPVMLSQYCNIDNGVRVTLQTCDQMSASQSSSSARIIYDITVKPGDERLHGIGLLLKAAVLEEDKYSAWPQGNDVFVCAPIAAPDVRIEIASGRVIRVVAGSKSIRYKASLDLFYILKMMKQP